MEDEFDVSDSSGIKDLRDAAERGRKATQELDDMKREMAFIKAGVDTDSKAGQLLYKAYDGELETELIQAEASELGILQRQEIVSMIPWMVNWVDFDSVIRSPMAFLARDRSIFRLLITERPWIFVIVPSISLILVSILAAMSSVSPADL